MDDAAGSIGKIGEKKKKARRKTVPKYSVRPPWLGCYPTPGGWAGLSTTAEWGWGRHSLEGCPSLNTSKFYCVLRLAGSRVPRGIKTLRNFKENSAGLNLCWCWGSQFKLPPSWECRLLAPKQPQQCTVDPEGISLHGPFVRSFRGESSEAQALSCLLLQISLNFTARKWTCPRLRWTPGNKGGHEKVLPPCGHFV